jgi:hypothetical protein
MKIEEITHNHLKDYEKGQLIVVENISTSTHPKTKKVTETYLNAGVVELVGVWGDWVVWLNQDGKDIVERLSHLKKKTKLHILNK